MAEPMRIRATLQGDVADVRILMSIRWKRGSARIARPDRAGPLHPERARLAQRQDRARRAVESGRVARPFPGLRVKGAKAGDKISVTWTDNKGDKRTDEATVAAAS